MAGDGVFEQAREFFVQGLAQYEAGRLAEAERSFEAALALVPGRPSALTNLGATRLKLGRAAEALVLLDEALAQEPDNLDALGHRATALAELGRHEEALQGFDRTLALDPRLADVWTLRGSVLKELGRADEAAASFEEALARGGNAQLNRYYLAGLARGAAPPAAPTGYVQALFDSYAPAFDTELVELLNYRGPQVLSQRLAQFGRRFARALDLGCGTGLCGPLVKPLVDRLEGVDLSAEMLRGAQARGVYDALAQAELGEFLDAATPGYDLVLAADVFVYVGALDGVFAGLARCMAPDGVFCFSVEEAQPPDTLVLRPSLRYAHSEAHVRELAARHGFEVAGLLRAPIREDQRVPIPGIYFWLVRAA